MRNLWNWMLVFSGLGMVLVEVLLGAFTGFDFALVGTCLMVGGGVGLFFGSAKVGLASTAALAAVYLVFFRKYVRSKVTAPDKPSNVDTLIGRKGVVTEEIGPHNAGQVRVGGEVWRATLVEGSQETRAAGQSVVVESVDGVTLHVR